MNERKGRQTVKRDRAEKVSQWLGGKREGKEGMWAPSVRDRDSCETFDVTKTCRRQFGKI